MHCGVIIYIYILCSLQSPIASPSRGIHHLSSELPFAANRRCSFLSIRFSRTRWSYLLPLIAQLTESPSSGFDGPGSSPFWGSSLSYSVSLAAQNMRWCHDRYQRKTGSILLADISTRRRISFAVSRLARLSQKMRRQTEWYSISEESLYHIWSIHDGHDDSSESNLIYYVCASDSSLADNEIDRELSGIQYDPVWSYWLSSEQTTTSSTEAELLALSWNWMINLGRVNTEGTINF